MSKVTLRSSLSSIVCGVALLFTPTTIHSQTVVTSIADDGGPGTLRYVIEHADSGAVVTIAPTVTDTIALLQGELVIERPITIIGPGMDHLAISGEDVSRVILNRAPYLLVSDLTLTRGYGVAGRCGGAVRNESGQIHLTRVRVSDSQAGHALDADDALGTRAGRGSAGGGICVVSGKLWMKDSEVLRNRAGNGGNGRPAIGGIGGGAGGGIAGTADLDDVLVQGNAAGMGGVGITGGGGGGPGGGLYGRIDVKDSRLIENRAGDGGSLPEVGIGGDGGSGGAYFSYTSATVVRSKVLNNLAGNGGEGLVGGIGGGGGGLGGWTLRISETEIVGNRAGNGGNSVVTALSNGGDGGGVFVDGFAHMSNSAVLQNRSGDSGLPSGRGGRGGGVFGQWSRLIIEASTISGNTTGFDSDGVPGTGGAISMEKYHFRGLEISSSTIVNNGGYGGGIVVLDAGTPTTLLNSIVADNMDRGSDSSPNADCYIGSASVTSRNNLIISNRGCPVGSSTISVKPAHLQSRVFEPLADNGGPTPTHALHPSSPAIDAGYCPDDLTDQRGYGNPDGGRAVDLGKKDPDTACDIGSFEFRAVPVVVAEVAQKTEVTSGLAIVDGFELEPIYPNPTRGFARSAITVPESQEIRIDLYDVLGRELSTVFDGYVEKERRLEFTISGEQLAPGNYFLRLSGKSGSLIRTLVVTH